jgi:hypothetical protein
MVASLLEKGSGDKEEQRRQQQNVKVWCKRLNGGKKVY